MSATARASAGTGDYDADNDGLIEITTLAQLNAIRWDLDGDGIPLAGKETQYNAAFPNAEDNMGCNESAVTIQSNNTGNEPCEGYELRANLDFDTGTKGARADDAYYNSGAGWTPIGSAANPYAAKFDGGNATYTITNLHVNLSSTSATSHAGLFGVIGTGAEIQNVALTAVSVTGSTTSTVVYVGALAGRNQGTITESWSLGAVTGHRTGTGVGDDSVVGGLVGRNDGTIRAAYSRAAATATAHDSNEALAGGLVGHNSDAGEIAASYAAGDATANRGTDTTGAADNNSFAGGLVGQNGGTITASYATGHAAAVGKNTHAGGLVGDNNGAINAKAAITASYSLGKPSAATGTGTERKGGLVGANRNHATITASYWDKTTSEITTGSNGVGKTTSELQTPTAYGTGANDIYKDWNVNVDAAAGDDDPWDFGTTSQYPVLKFGSHVQTKQRATVTITANPTAIWERAASTLTPARVNQSTITATLSGKWEDDLTITPPAAVSGLYTLSAAAITIPAGSTTETVTLTAVDDTTDQTSPDSRSVSLSNTTVDSDVVAVSVTNATITINDDDNVAKAAGVSAHSIPAKTTEVKIKWTQAAGATGYKVQWKSGAQNYASTRQTTISSGTTLTGNATGLTAGTEYTFRVISTKTNELDAPPSDEIKFTPNTDYDTDNDGLIEVPALAQLNAVRYDLNGDGAADNASDATNYNAAFPNAASDMGCAETGCEGYELSVNLDFDTNSSGGPNSGDTYWNGGLGWQPIADGATPFTGEFHGKNGTTQYTISNLFIDRDATTAGTKYYAGLFGRIDAGAEIKNVKLTGVSVTLESATAENPQPNVYAGGLVGYQNAGTITGSSVAGSVKAVVKAPTPSATATKAANAGGLVGVKKAGDIISSYARANVTAEHKASAGDPRARAGGLVGLHESGRRHSIPLRRLRHRQSVQLQRQRLRRRANRRA